jgi:hypothetical protein
MDLQHVNVKLMLDKPEQLDFEPLVPVFHNWIQNQVFDELLLDVADYRHVPEGPGVMLIGHRADYSVDNTDNRPGVLYNRKAPLDGSNQDRLKQAAIAALAACEKLEAEPKLKGELRFGGREVEVYINDRLIAPNDDASRAKYDADLRAFSEKLFGSSDFLLTYERNPRRRFGVTVKSAKPFGVRDLLRNLAS